MSTYVELHCHSNYSFQDGASSVYELLEQAKKLHYSALAITDHNNLCGVVEFARAARFYGIQPIIGSEVTLEDGSHITLLVKSREGYANLCRIISSGSLSSHGKSFAFDRKHFDSYNQGLILLTGVSMLTASWKLWQSSKNISHIDQWGKPVDNNCGYRTHTIYFRWHE